MALDVAGDSAVASLEIPLQLTGLEETKAQIIALGPLGDQAGKQIAAGLGSGAGAAAATAANTKNLSATLTGAAGAAANAAGGIGGFARSVAQSAEATDRHGLSTGRLTRAMELLAVESTGANHALATGAVVLGEFAAGNVAVLAAVTAIGVGTFIYDKLTEGTRKAREEQDKLVASLDNWYKTQQAGPAGDLVEQINAVTHAIDDLQKSLDKTAGPQASDGILARLEKGINAGPTDAVDRLKILGAAFIEGSKAASTSPLGTEFQVFLKALDDATAKYMADSKAKITSLGDERAAALAEADRKLTEQARKDQQDFVSNLATSVSAGGPGVSQLAFFAQDSQRQLDFLRSAQPDASAGDAYRQNLERQAEQLRINREATDALRSAEFARLDTLNETIAESEKQRALQDLLNVSGKNLTATINAETDALRKEADASVTSHPEPADAFRITGGPLGDLTTFRDNVKADENALNDFTRSGLTQYNDGLSKSSEVTRQASDDAARLAVVIGRDLLGSVAELSDRGAQSFSDFARAIEAGAVRLDGALAGAIEKQQELQEQARKTGDLGALLGISARVDQLKQYQAQVGTLTGALAGGQAGFSAGAQFGLGGGALYGGASGAATAAAAGAGPLGIGIAAASGIVGAFLGAAEAHRQAAAALKAAGDQIDKSLTNYGAQTGVAGQLAQNQSGYSDILAAIQADARAAGRSGDRAGLTRAAEQAEQLDAERAANAKEISDDFWDSITQKINTLNGPAGAFANQVDDLNKQYAQDIASALALGATQQQLDAITKYYADSLDRLKAAEEEAAKQTQASLDARLAAAQGDQRLADQITRQAAEEKELADAVAAGYTKAQLDELKYIQALEDEAAVKAKLVALTQSLASSLAQGPGGTAASSAAADQASLIDQINKDAEQYANDIAAGADATTLFTDQLNLAADAAALAAKQFQATVAALQQSTSDIEQAVSGGFLSGTAGLGQERSNIAGFAGVDVGTLSTDDAIRALYTVPDGVNELTNSQRALNSLIDQYFKDEQQWGSQTANNTASIAQAASGGGIGSADTAAIRNAASGLSEVTGNRMADYLASANIHLVEIRDAILGHGSLTSTSDTRNITAPSVPTLPAFSSAPSPPATLPPIPIKIDVNVTSDGTRPATTPQQFVTELLRAIQRPDVEAQLQKSLDESLRALYAGKQRKAGDNTVIGQ